MRGHKKKKKKKRPVGFCANMGKREAIVFILLASFTLLCNGLFCVSCVVLCGGNVICFLTSTYDLLQDADTGICTEENNHASRKLDTI